MPKRLIGKFWSIIDTGLVSSFAKVTSGVHQGTVLACLLFLCYINDITTVYFMQMMYYFTTLLVLKKVAENFRLTNILNDWCDLEDVF